MTEQYGSDGRIKGKFYESELLRLQDELVSLQDWIKAQGLRVAVIFEGRDAAGKGGVIKRITQRLNARIVKVVALGSPRSARRASGTFSATCLICRLPARWFCSIGAGTTGRA